MLRVVPATEMQLFKTLFLIFNLFFRILSLQTNSLMATNGKFDTAIGTLSKTFTNLAIFIFNRQMVAFQIVIHNLRAPI